MTSLDHQLLRDAFGSFMTGVTVVTTKDASGQPVGFTANSFTSVSMQPPLLLVCPAKSLSFIDAFNHTDTFCVNILASHQQETSSLFASFQGDRFKHVDWHEDQHGCAVIDQSLAHFSCKRYAAYEGGDHLILVGEVKDFSVKQGQGLGYNRGGYFSLDMERAAQRRDANSQVGVLLRHDNRLLLLEDERGFRLPTVEISNQDDAVDSIVTFLRNEFATHIRVGNVYSVYGSAQHEDSIYYRASTDANFSDRFTAVALNDLQLQKYSSETEKVMIMRYVQEARLGNHKLYVGGRDMGMVHSLSGDES